MKALTFIIRILRNKYLLTLICFVVWIIFFDRNDFFTQMERRRDLKQIEESKAYYTKEIETNRKFSNDLKSNAAIIEKYAREKYLMKRDNEDLFIIQSAEKK